MATNAIRCGIAIFDDVKNPVCGLASLAGGDNFRFTTVGDLQSEHIWVTNLTFKDAYSVRLHNNPKIKLSNFFRTELDRLASELGLDLVNRPHAAMPELSKVADRVLSLCANLYSITKFKDSLRKTIEDIILPDHEPELTPVVSAAIDNAFKYHQLCWGKRDPSHSSFYLRFSRTKFAQFITSLPVPQGAWQQITDKFPLKNGNIKSGVKSRIYILLEQITARQPALVKIGVSDVNTDVAHLLDYGNGTDDREWVPAQEAAQIAAYADVTIHGMIVADGYTTLDQSYAKRLHMLDNGQANGFSIGLLAENHLHAIYSKRKLNVNGQFKNITPARSTFLRAWDRATCFKVAAALQQRGFQVLSYGSGTIQVSCSQADVKKLQSVAVDLGLSPPLAMNAHMVRHAEVEELTTDTLKLNASNERTLI